MRFQIGWAFNIPLAIRRMLHQLPVSIAVTLRRADRAKAFHNKQAVIRRIKLHLVNGAARDHEVIAIIQI